MLKWYFIFFVWLPTGQVEIEQFGPFKNKGQCYAYKELVVMQMPAEVLRYGFVDCWQG